MTQILTGRGVLLWFVAFFGIVFATNAYFITVAVRSFRGEDEAKPYLQGIEYNDTLAKRAEQRKLGWKAEISGTRLPSGTIEIDVRVRHADGSPESAAQLSGILRHPMDATRDHSLTLKLASPGLYRAALSGVAPGAWDVSVGNSVRDAPFEATRRVWLP